MKQAGLDHLELPIRTSGHQSRLGDDPLVTTDSTLNDLKAVEQLLAANDVRVSSCNILSGNPSRPGVLDIIKRKIDLASHFGVSLVVGEAGDADDETSRAELYRLLAQIGDYAGALGITYCLETHAGLCVNHRSMLDTMSRLGHPNVKLNFDTGNLLFYNEHINGEIALAKVCHHVRHLHLKDTTGQFGRRHFPALGYGGAVDFSCVLDSMRSCGFSGPYSIEVPGTDGEGDLPLDAYHRRVRKSVAHLRTCGYFN